MRFFAESPIIPDRLLHRRDKGQVVFFCGAGVSMNAGMPNFEHLTESVVDKFDPPPESEIRETIQLKLPRTNKPIIPLDQIFNLLQQEYGREAVEEAVIEKLSLPKHLDKVPRNHQIIRKISADKSGNPQIVTTNFDRLFEMSDDGKKCPVYLPPAFPDLSLDMPINGISYLHGRLPDTPQATSGYRYPLVLSSSDFGRAYLAAGWATNFVRNLLTKYTVVLVGYQAEDPPIKYLLQGLNYTEKSGDTGIYAFDKGDPADIKGKWKHLGVNGIGYSDHSVLWDTLEAWAERAGDYRVWESKVTGLVKQDPKILQPHERGQVAHLISTAAGAEAFRLASPLPEWICVLDASCRYAVPSKNFGEDAEVFDPLAHYGLDDAPPRLEHDQSKDSIRFENFLQWNEKDENPHTAHNLNRTQFEGREDIPSRLSKIIWWIAQSLDSPVMAWWAARQWLHPNLIHAIRSELDHDNALHSKARLFWNLIIERSDDIRQRRLSYEIFELQSRVETEGWSNAVLRDFTAFSKPKVECHRPSGLSESKPPEKTWENIHLSEVTNFKILFEEYHGETLEIPDDVLEPVLVILQQSFNEAAGLLKDINKSFFTTPTCYPNRDKDDGNEIGAFVQEVRRFITLFDRLSDFDPKTAAAIASIWPVNECFFFGKFCLYAANKPELFDATKACLMIDELDQNLFWKGDFQRELLFLMANRWAEFSDEEKKGLSARILKGPDKLEHESDEDFKENKERMIFRRGRWLQQQGCIWPTSESEQLDNIANSHPDWTDENAKNVTDTHFSGNSGWVSTNENPEILLGIPISEIIDKAGKVSRLFTNDFIDEQPFIGLVKSHPHLAIAALTDKAKQGEYPKDFWFKLLYNWPCETPDRLTKLMLHGVAELPYSSLRELSYAVSHILNKNLLKYLEMDHDLVWLILDKSVNALLNDKTGAATKSDIEEMQAQRTNYYGPITDLTKILIQIISTAKPEKNSKFSQKHQSRFEKLLAIPIDARYQAVATLTRDFQWFYFIDPEWTSQHLLPLLDFEHADAKPAWLGFFHEDSVCNKPTVEVVKNLLLDIFPRIYSFGWDDRPINIAAYGLIRMYIFGQNEPHGITDREARECLRKMSDRTRQSVIFWLVKAGNQNNDEWSELVVPFIKKIWPREVKIKTEGSIIAWIRLLAQTGKNFPKVYEAVKPHLAPINCDGYCHWLYQFSNEKKIAAKYPDEVLDLLDTIAPQSTQKPLHEFKDVLRLIEETDENLAGDWRFNRLLEMTEKR